MTDLRHLAECLRRVTVEVAVTGASLGSGVLWPPGHVVTNAHVVRGSHAGVRLVDGRRLEGRVIARDTAADLALLRVSGAGIPAAAIAVAGATQVGALVVAVGHPLGVRGALTVGIIHAVGPQQGGGRPWIQADLRLARGNSGGPLADARGHVVGLNTMVVGTLALAIPMSDVAQFVRAAGVNLS
jgi:serine protease Do